MSDYFYVYILADVHRKRRVLYTGVTNDFVRRVREHQEASFGFTAKYNVRTLVYSEAHSHAENAIRREDKSKVGLERRSWR